MVKYSDLVICDSVNIEKDYFCPKDHKTGLICATKNTATIHHFAGSWVTGKERKWLEFTRRQRANGNVLTIKFLDSRLCDVIKKLYVRDIKTNLNKVKEKLCIILKST